MLKSFDGNKEKETLTDGLVRLADLGDGFEVTRTVAAALREGADIPLRLVLFIRAA